jgi:hypothetical protein
LSWSGKVSKSSSRTPRWSARVCRVRTLGTASRVCGAASSACAWSILSATDL